MLTSEVASIARETCVDVAIVASGEAYGSVGCIDFLSTRNGVKGAMICVGNPLAYGDSGWYPLADLELCGETARKVVARYL